MENTDIDQAKHTAEPDVDQEHEPLEKIGRKLKEVSDQVGCKANVVLENFGKQD